MTRTRAFWIAAIIVIIATVAIGVRVSYKYKRVSDDYAAPGVLDDVSEKVEVREGPEETGAWNTYHGDAALSGAVSAALPDKFALLWRFRAGAPVSNTPVVATGRVFVANAKGEVVAADLHGELLWSVALTRGTREDGTPEEEVIDAPLACFDEVLLAGTADGTLYALDVATGEEKWRYEVGEPVLGTPNLLSVPAAGEEADRAAVVVVSQSDGALHSVALADGQPIWQTEGVSRCDGSPAVGDGLVVFGSCVAALHVFSAADGKLERDIEVGADSEVAGGVAVYGDAVFTGSRSGRVLQADLRTGDPVWVNEDAEDEVFTTPAVNRDSVVFASSDGYIYALDRETGNRRWQFDTNGAPSSPVIAGDKVVVASDGFLHVVRLEDGAPVWSYEVSDVITGPAVVGRMIIVGSEDGTVTAFGEPAA
jgi:outer membrane protein assembly factor BamB